MYYKVFSIVCFILFFSNQLIADDLYLTAADLIDKQLEELVSMDIEVESAGKSLIKAFDLPYPAFVITADDIKRLKIFNIPEALRLAPGVEVAQISGGEWSVAVRGIGGRFSRFVLVMVNDRAVYNSAFSGANWDEINIPMTNIKRIEVIRGANADSWGANAVNGIINIITFSPEELLSSRLIAHLGDRQKGADFVLIKKLTNDWFNSFSGYFANWDGLQNADKSLKEEEHQDWRLAYQLEQKLDDQLFQLEVEQFSTRQSSYWPLYNPPFIMKQALRDSKTGYVVQLKYEKQFDEGISSKIRASYDAVDRDSNLYVWNSDNFQFDIDFQSKSSNNVFNAGLNFRRNSHLVNFSTRSPIQIKSDADNVYFWGGYLSENLFLLDKNIELKLSARLDKNNLTGYEFQPAFRALWKVSDFDRFWFARSLAASTASRVAIDVERTIFGIIPASQPNQPYPLLLDINSNKINKNTRVFATEIGYRHLWENMNIDISLFDYDYQNELMLEPVGQPILSNFPPTANSYLTQSLAFASQLMFDSKGGEISYLGKISTNWQLQISYAHISINHLEEVARESVGAENLFSLQSSHEISDDFNLNWWVRHSSGNSNILIKDYLSFDFNVNYQVEQNFNLSFSIKNYGSDKFLQGIREVFFLEGFYTEPTHSLLIDWSF